MYNLKMVPLVLAQIRRRLAIISHFNVKNVDHGQCVETLI